MLQQGFFAGPFSGNKGTAGTKLKVPINLAGHRNSGTTICNRSMPSALSPAAIIMLRATSTLHCVAAYGRWSSFFFFFFAGEDSTNGLDVFFIFNL